MRFASPLSSQAKPALFGLKAHIEGTGDGVARFERIMVRDLNGYLHVNFCLLKSKTFLLPSLFVTITL